MTHVMHARCVQCRELQPVPSDSARTDVGGGAQELLDIRCARVLPSYSERAGQVCGGRLRPHDCQDHSYSAHIDYWHGTRCTVPRPDGQDPADDLPAIRRRYARSGS